MGRLDDRTLPMFKKPRAKQLWAGPNHMPALMVAFAFVIYEELGIPVPVGTDPNEVLQYTRRNNRIEVYTWQL